jgi:hypothetical protein
MGDDGTGADCRMPYRANEGGALVSGVVNYIKEISEVEKRSR